MAVRITEPANMNPGTADWQQILHKLTVTAGGFLVAGLTNMDTAGVPQVMEGSRFEINGSFYKTTADETITGASGLANGTAYIYAYASGNGAVFKYSAIKPGFSPAKGGWYNGNERAIAKLFYSSGQYNGKVILDSYNAINLINTSYTIPTTGGVLVANGAINSETVVTLPAGAYRYELKGGSGGNGGIGGNGGSILPGGSGAQGEVKYGIFFLADSKQIILNTGGNGIDGKNGLTSSNNNNGGGGGGSTGGSSYIFLYESFF